MKKFIITATIILASGMFLTSCNKHHAAAPTPTISFNYLSQFSAKQDIGSAD